MRASARRSGCGTTKESSTILSAHTYVPRQPLSSLLSKQILACLCMCLRLCPQRVNLLHPCRLLFQPPGSLTAALQLPQNLINLRCKQGAFAGGRPGDELQRTCELEWKTECSEGIERWSCVGGDIARCGFCNPEKARLSLKIASLYG